MGHKAPVVDFRYTIGCTFPFMGQTISFASIAGSNQPLDSFYEKAYIGFSVTANSGTFGARWAVNNPAGNKNMTMSSILNTAPHGNTGIGASAGFFTFNKQPGIEGTTQVTFYGGAFVTPTFLEIDRAAGASTSATIIVAGRLWNPSH